MRRSRFLEREQSKIKDLAREYRGQGYEVLVEPLESDVPEFLRPYRPDLIARKGGETIVVEVKSRTSLSDTSLAIVPQILKDRPGWRFDLVLTNPKRPPTRSETDDNKDDIQEEEATRRLDQAEKLSAQGYFEAALLLAHSALEVFLREIAEENSIEFEMQGAQGLLGKLYSLGLLSRQDYESVAESVEIRNRVVHGFKSSEINAEAVAKIVNLGRRIAAGSED